MRRQKKYHYIYKTTCQVTGKFYVGMHSTDNLDDGYLGSGKILGYSRKKYGDESHKKEIIEMCPSREALKLREKEIVNEQLLADPLNINLKYGGEGGFEHQNLNSAVQSEKGKRGNLKMKYLREDDEEWVERKSRKLSNSLKRAYEEGRREARFCDWTGKTHKEETKRKIGAKNSLHQRGEGNSQFGTCWMTDGISSFKVKRPDVKRYLELGYSLGRTIIAREVLHGGTRPS